MERLQKLNLDLTSSPINNNLFSHVTMAPPDPILGTAIAFNNDKSADKINLGIGAYRDNNGKPYVFKIVRKVEDEIVKNSNKVCYLSKFTGVLAYRRFGRIQHRRTKLTFWRWQHRHKIGPSSHMPSHFRHGRPQPRFHLLESVPSSVGIHLRPHLAQPQEHHRTRWIKVGWVPVLWPQDQRLQLRGYDQVFGGRCVWVDCFVACMCA